MGALADGALQGGGLITGVIPYFLKTKEVVHEGISELITVDTMHERKLKMHDLSDGIIAMPGGWGTMEELFEMLTWSQLGLHTKPVGLLNLDGYYDSLLAFLRSSVATGFMNNALMDLIKTGDDAEPLLSELVEASEVSLATTRLDQI